MVSWQRLCEIIEAGGRQSIVVLGDYMLDRYLYGDAERISPEAPVPVLRVVRQEQAIGGAGSVVADIRALEAAAYCVGIIGQDENGKALGSAIEKMGADVSGLVAVAGRPTTLKTRLVGLAQHRHRQQLIRIDDESTEPIDAEIGRALIESLRRLIANCDALCIEDYNKGVITRETAQAAIKLAREHGKPVIVDPASISDYSIYAGASLITPNRSETQRACDVFIPSAAAVRANATKILAACHTERVCVTLDAEGCAIIGPNGHFEHVTTKTRDVYDVTGAGDEVLAALAVALAAGANSTEAATLANYAGGLEVEKFGCVPVTKDELIGEILMEHHRSIGKLRTVDQLLPELARRRERGEKVAFTNGCFDILHAGHVSVFAFAKTHADIVVLGLNSDASVRGQGKGDDRPIVPQEDRAAVLAGLGDVDYIVLFDEDTPELLIRSIRPDVLLKGADWKGKRIAGQEFVENNGGRVELVPLLESRSTSALLERIRKSS
jgi:D-beta-D-heptose 7-phosphate kinase/D-beta-D-heptose 1-phosphate adenosyltransferase